MKKSDLKTGFKVIKKDGSECLVLLNYNSSYREKEDLIVDMNGNFNWDTIEAYNEDLTHSEYEDLNIIEVLKSEHCYSVFQDQNRFKSIWKKDQTPEYTMEELTEKLGHTFKIKK